MHRNSINQKLGEKKPEDTADPKDIGLQIEEALFSKFKDVSFDYKTKYRSISFNLQKNLKLRDSVMQGTILASELVNMTAQEMACDELQKERKRFADYHLEAAKLVQLNQTSTDMFKCGKCGRRETTYHLLQTRSADEPMTTFHCCTFCGHRWKS